MVKEGDILKSQPGIFLSIRVKKIPLSSIGGVENDEPRNDRERKTGQKKRKGARAGQKSFV